MEDYVLIGSVLQAMHMSKFKKKPKHLKKYEIGSCKTHRPQEYNSVSYEGPLHLYHGERLSTKPLAISNTNMNKQRISSAEGNCKNKLKIKFILDQSEKICDRQINERNQPCFYQFFTKKQIEPKISREHTSRTIALIKTPDTTNGFFYDPSLELTRRKSPRCIILPQKKRVEQPETLKEPMTKVDIRKLVKQQWEEQKRRRKAQCKTSSSCLGRRKNSMQRQTKRIEQEIKNRELEDRQQKISVVQRGNSKKLVNFSENYNQNVLPLSKDEIKSKTVSMIHKYGLDSAKCCIKII